MVVARRASLVAALSLACVAEAAELEHEHELAPTLSTSTSTSTNARTSTTTKTSTGSSGLAMPELALVDRALEPAREPVPAFLPRWAPAAHDPGELPRWIRHTTIPHETIEQLALRYDVDPRALRDWNKLGPDEQLHPRRAKSLRVFARANPPPRERLEHVVVEGDGWGGIARRYGVDPSELRAWNVGEVGRSLEPGEILQLWVDPVVLTAILDDQPGTARAALVRPGAHGVGTPQAGVLVDGVQIPPGPGYELRFPNSAWGTSFAVREAIAGLDRFVAASEPGRPVMVGTMSRQRGGAIAGHNSHQTGRDLDIRLPNRPEVPRAFAPTLRRVDWARTWALVAAFAQSDAVEVVFLDYDAQRRLYKAAQALGVAQEILAATIQYPRGSQANLGLVRHSPGHEGHIHVRFTCGVAEPECR